MPKWVDECNVNDRTQSPSDAFIALKIFIGSEFHNLNLNQVLLLAGRVGLFITSEELRILD